MTLIILICSISIYSYSINTHAFKPNSTEIIPQVISLDNITESENFPISPNIDLIPIQNSSIVLDNITESENFPISPNIDLIPIQNSSIVLDNITESEIFRYHPI